MTPALQYLLTRSFLNGLTTRLRRLRQPKYLIGAILGVAYFYFYFYQFLFGGGLMKGPAVFPGVLWPHIGAALLLVAMVAFSWIIPASRAAVQFTEAEIAFLFPAPIARRTLIIHKLIKSQLTFLILAVVITLITGRFRAGSEAWFRMAGWWMILNTLNLHRIGASFALQRLREAGMADWKRRLAVVLAIIALVAGVVLTRDNLPTLPGMDAKGRLPDYTQYALQAANSAPLVYVLEPFRWVVGPYFARDVVSFLDALGPAFAVLLLHFLWVVRADVSFEEASIAAAQKRAALLSAVNRGDFRRRSAKARTPVWRLRPTGFAPFAFLWKSCIRFGGRRALGLWLLLFVALFIAVAFVRGQLDPKPTGAILFVVMTISVVCYITLLISLIMVGQHASSQLRQAMGAFDLIKTYPLPGWKIALGELLGVVVIGSLLQWAALGVATFLASGFIARNPDGATALYLGSVALALFLPAFNLATAVLPSGAALMFPAWFKPQEGAGPGLENTGIRLLMGIGQLLAMALSLLPVAFFGACAWFVTKNFGLPWPWCAGWAIGVGAIVLALESAMGVAWLGDLYDEYDLSQSS